LGQQRGRDDKAVLRTIINLHLVLATTHGGSVVTQSQFAEGGQAGSAHPHMELLPVMDVRNRDVVAVFGIHDTPVRWRAHLIDSVDSLLVQVAVACPCDALVGHGIVDRVGIVTAVQQAWGDETVVEERVCDQTARIVGLA